MARNTHITHAEDRILTDGTAGAKEVIEMLKQVSDFLMGSGGQGGVEVTTKWDGAPAVVCGIDPSDGKFFVGHKTGVFAKDPKICKTQADVQKYYSGGLAQKLSECLKYLPSCNIKGVLQGDLMFTPGDKRTETINGKRLLTWTPNTITYAVDPSTPLGQQIERASLGIVFVNKYQGSSLPTMTASYKINDSDFTSSGEVWAQKAEFKDIGNVANLSQGERAKFDAAIRKAEGSVSQCKGILSKIQSGKKTLAIDTLLLQFFNNYVKEGQPIPSVNVASKDFYKFVAAQYDKAIKKLGTIKGQGNKAGKYLESFLFMEEHEKQMKMLIATYMNIMAAKMIIVKKMKKVSELKTFVNTGKGFQVTSPEGFVAIKGQKATKLVDRLEFSKLNFTIPKQWEKRKVPG